MEEALREMRLVSGSSMEKQDQYKAMVEEMEQLDREWQSFQVVWIDTEIEGDEYENMTGNV